MGESDGDTSGVPEDDRSARALREQRRQQRKGFGSEDRVEQQTGLTECDPRCAIPRIRRDSVAGTASVPNVDVRRACRGCSHQRGTLIGETSDLSPRLVLRTAYRRPNDTPTAPRRNGTRYQARLSCSGAGCEKHDLRIDPVDRKLCVQFGGSTGRADRGDRGRAPAGQGVGSFTRPPEFGFDSDEGRIDRLARGRTRKTHVRSRRSRQSQIRMVRSRIVAIHDKDTAQASGSRGQRRASTVTRSDSPTGEEHAAVRCQGVGDHLLEESRLTACQCEADQVVAFDIEWRRSQRSLELLGAHQWSRFRAEHEARRSGHGQFAGSPAIARLQRRVTSSTMVPHAPVSGVIRIDDSVNGSRWSPATRRSA